MPEPSRRSGHQNDPGPRFPDRAAFSEFLLAARQSAGLSLDEIATVSKVPPRHLEALEQGRVADLPRGVYRRSILRTYASAVGLDPSLVLERFSQAFGTDAAFSEWEIVPPPKGARSIPVTASAVTVDTAPPAIVARRATKPQSVPSGPPTRLVAVGAAVLLLLAVGYSWIGGPSAPDSAGGVESASAVPVDDGAAARVLTTANGGATQTMPAANSQRDVVLPAPEAEPEPPAQAPSQLVVTSIPAGARVTIDGIGWGVTPITIRHLPPGVKRIRVTLDGYVGQDRDVRIGDEGGVVSARITLQPRN
jgi:transcriptional regulator with XRE-family HTH domain